LTISAADYGLTFTDTISATADDTENLEIDLGTGTVYFRSGVGVGTNIKYPNTVTLKSNATKDTDGAFELKAAKLDFVGTGTSGVTLTSSGNAAINLTCDTLTHTYATNTINAGTGNVTIVPLTSSKNVFYGDTPAGTGTDAKYSSLWTTFTGGKLILGNKDAQNVTLSATGTTSTSFGSTGLPYELVVQNSGGSIINITGDYKSNNKALTLQNAPDAAGTDGKINIGNGVVTAYTISLGTGKASFQKNVELIATADSTTTINATGGIDFGVYDADTPANSRIVTITAANTNSHKLILDADSGTPATSGKILINGSVGSTTNPLGAFSLITSNPATDAIKLGDDITTKRKDATYNGQVSLGAKVTIVASSGITIETGDTGTGTGGDITLSGDIAGAGKSLTLDTLCTGTDGSAGTVTLAAHTAITINDLKITGPVHGGGASPSYTYNFDITNTGTVTLEDDIKVRRLHQTGSGTGTTEVILGRDTYNDSRTETVIETSSASSVIFNSDIILYYHISITELTGGNIETKNIYSAYNNWNLSLTSKAGSGSGYNNYIEIDGNIGTVNDSTVPQRVRLGNVIFNCGKLSFTNTNIYSTGNILLASASSATYPYTTYSYITGNLALYTSGGNISITRNTRHEGNLDIAEGSFDIGTYSYLMSTANDAPSDGFKQANGTLTLGSENYIASIIIGTGTGRNFNIGSDLTFTAHYTSTIEMNGTGTITLGTPASQKIGNFVLGDNAVVTAATDIVITGNWTQPWGSTQHFIHGSKTVTFAPESDDTTTTISGNTHFYNFTCVTPGSTIKFSNWTSTDDAHRISGKWTVTGTGWEDDECITLTGVYAPEQWPAPNPAPTDPDENFWVVHFGDAANLNPVSDFQFMNVLNSWAFHDASYDGIIITPANVHLNTIKSGKNWCMYWMRDTFYLIYSFTEDTNGNGKIDRLRIQATQYMIGDFSNFSVANIKDETNNPYTVKDYKFSAGKTSVVIEDAEDLIFVNLHERDTFDTSATLTWELEKGSSIKNALGNTISTPPPTTTLPPINFPLHTVDTAPPRIAYSLSSPDSPQEFIQFSEPLLNMVTIIGGGQPFATSNISSPTPALQNGWLFTLNNAFTTSDIANDDIRYNDADVFKDLTDVASGDIRPPNPYPDFIDSPKDAKYPAGALPDIYNDNDYVKVVIDTDPNPSVFIAALAAKSPLFDNITGAMKFVHTETTNNDWSGGRRVSDLLLLRPMPSSIPAPDSNGYIWPDYAQSIDNKSDPLIIDYKENKDIGRITNQWDASKDLMLSAGILFEVFDTVAPPAAPVLTYILDAKNHNDDLWLPSISTAPDVALNFVPQESTSSKDATPVEPDEKHQHAYKIEKPTEGQVKFIFRIAGKNGLPIFGVRYDGTWYEVASFRSFSFNLRKITRQRGGATILNNVINPNRGEFTTLAYQLTKGGSVNIIVSTLDGKIITTLCRERRDAGDHFVTWDGRNKSGKPVARGLYFIRIVAPDIDEIRKVMVVK
jgi:hypothetical protein